MRSKPALASSNRPAEYIHWNERISMPVGLSGKTESTREESAWEDSQAGNSRSVALAQSARRPRAAAVRTARGHFGRLGPVGHAKSSAMEMPMAGR